MPRCSWSALRVLCGAKGRGPERYAARTAFQSTQTRYPSAIIALEAPKAVGQDAMTRDGRGVGLSEVYGGCEGPEDPPGA